MVGRGLDFNRCSWHRRICSLAGLHFWRELSYFVRLLLIVFSKAPIASTAGTVTSSIIFPETVSNTHYSICTVSRYKSINGPQGGALRIFQGTSTNWLHGTPSATRTLARIVTPPHVIVTNKFQSDRNICYQSRSLEIFCGIGLF